MDGRCLLILIPSVVCCSFLLLLLLLELLHFSGIWSWPETDDAVAAPRKETPILRFRKGQSQYPSFMPYKFVAAIAAAAVTTTAAAADAAAGVRVALPVFIHRLPWGRGIVPSCP